MDTLKDKFEFAEETVNINYNPAEDQTVQMDREGQVEIKDEALRTEGCRE